MKGYGFHTDWSVYRCQTPSSNLSASAAPFSVNRSSPNDVSAPIMDSVEPADIPQYPLHSQSPSYGYDFFSNPNPIRELDSARPPMKPYGYSSSDDSSVQMPIFNNPGLDPINSFCPNNTKPAQPYYPSYVSSPFPSSFSTTMDESSFSGPGHRARQGCQDVKDTFNGEASRMIDWTKFSFPSENELDGKSYWWGTIKPNPVDFSNSSVMVSPPSSLEVHPEGSMSYTGSYDKHTEKHDIPSRVDHVSSAPVRGLFMDLNVGNSIAGGDIGNKIFYNTKEAYCRPNPGTAVGCFGLAHTRMPLDEPSSSNNAMISASDSNVSRDVVDYNSNVSRDVVDYIFKEMHGCRDPHATLDNLSLRLSANEDVNPVEKSFDGADRCNPAVDSPCWKGAPAIHFSRYEPSEALPPEYVQKKEKCFGSVTSVIQEPQNFLADTDTDLKKSCGKSVDHQVQNEISNQVMNLGGSPKKSLAVRFPSENCHFDGAATGPLQSEPSCYGQKYLNVNTKENDVQSNKSICNPEPLSFFTEYHAAAKKNLMFQKLNTLCTDGADGRSNVDNRLERGPSRTEEHSLSSTSSVVDAPTTVGKNAGIVSTHELNVQMLVGTMHNLSELLLSHCASGTYELKEQDRNVLKNVINNLNTCTLKNVEQLTCLQECPVPQTGNSECAGQSQETRQSASLSKQRVIQIGPESSKVELENPLVQEAKNLYDEGSAWISGSVPSSGEAEMNKEDNMTKALKEILSENFRDDDDGAAESQNLLYKNLWLEAEAALCSISYKARYNKMKIEMEKHELKVTEEQSNLNKSQSSAAKMQIDSFVPNATDLKKPSDLKFSVDMKKPHPSTPERKNGKDLDGFNQDSTVSGSANEAVDDVASVLARFHVIKSRVDKSGTETVDLEEPSDIAAAKLPTGGSKSQNEDNFCQVSLTPCIKKADDYEASVMARLQILKSRLEDSSSLPSDEKSVDGFDGEGTDEVVITKALKGKNLDVNASPMHQSSDTAVDHEEIQAYGTYELANQLPTYYAVPTGFALDWEHIEKRSL